MTTDNGVKGQQFERTEEFDAFGPWVLPVRTRDEVPRLFRSFEQDPGSAQVVLKIPRRISRRDANPRMDLYDHLLVLRGDELTLLSRAPGDTGGVRRRVVTGDQLLAVEDGAELLDGRFSVRVLDEKPLVVRYNGASRDTMAPLVDGLRLLWRDTPPSKVGSGTVEHVPLGLRDLGPDVALVGEYRELIAAEPAMDLRGAHARLLVTPRDAGSMNRLVHKVWPMWLQGAVVCTDGVELMVLHRRSWWVRGSRPVHSIVRTVLPLTRTVPLEVVPTGYEDVEEIRVHHDAARFPVPTGSPTQRALLDLLES
ncbi:hypothetical protein OEB99_11615 [Actinotalea sp. M2MS4P-6]|uniref:hypothetical protein n=1 Tax=Actinotalea sp. M2MS4P-6 TaxID=2983762 RepID=UPI0021E38E50|nr:hypothetical protein [Actinotalea sp. M2MS4P-6]MCV2394955.1 hypothetical protein [Actinotalea sp. M2MS4P-6]